MKVKELVDQLQKVNPEAEVLLGYDGDLVVTTSYAVEEIKDEKQIGICWWRVKIGDVVILSQKP